MPADGRFKTIASNDISLIGNTVPQENISSYETGEILTQTLTEPNGTKIFNVVTPIHVSGQKIGTYDIALSLDDLEKEVFENQKSFAVLIAITIVVIILILSILIRLEVINPIKELEKGMRIIGSGDLDYKINIKRDDEIGNLASGFNEMAKRLKERTKALAEEKVNLENKIKERTKDLEELTNNLNEQVKQRTKDLTQKIEELESFQKLVVEREMRMIELKKEIRKLKGELGK